jgi:CRISPR-associated endonuclease/helicase Cas3
LRAVADLAGEFASTFGHSDWGRLAGLWHDLGKYSRSSKAISSAGTR